MLRRRAQVENRIAGGAKNGPLIRRGKITGSPVVRTVVRTAARIEEHDERRQILVLRAEPVSHPRANAREARQQRARVPLEMRDRVIVGTADAGADQRDIVDHDPMCGNSSETSIPDFPYVLNLYGLRITGPG